MQLRALLSVSANQDIIFDRYSDSAGAYVTLDSAKPQVYKTLFRAAKAKLKLRLRATIPGEENAPVPDPTSTSSEKPLGKLPSPHNLSSDTLTPLRAAPVVSPVIARTPAAPQANPAEKEFDSSSLTKSDQPEVSEEAPVPRAFTAPQSKQ